LPRYDCIYEIGRLRVDGEDLCLEDDLETGMEEGEYEVENSDAGEGDACPDE